MTEAEYAAAKDTLEGAIRDFYTKTSDSFITGWVLVAHRVSDELDEEGSSAVSRVAASGQRFHVTRGLLDVALTSERQDR